MQVNTARRGVMQSIPVQAAPTFDASTLRQTQSYPLSFPSIAVFLGSNLDELVRLEVAAGETVFLPPGWISATAVMQDSVALGGCWLQAGALDVQLTAWSLEVGKRLLSSWQRKICGFVCLRSDLKLHLTFAFGCLDPALRP